MNEPYLAASPGVAPPPQDDAAVIERSWDEPERFGAVFDAHYAEIHRYASRRLGRHAADDVSAETFALAFRQRRRYDLSRRSARPWLYGIATNLISRHRRDEVRLLQAVGRLRPEAEPALGHAAGPLLVHPPAHRLRGARARRDRRVRSGGARRDLRVDGTRTRRRQVLLWS
ncbi:sigma factor [Microbispora sp. NPDC088329]|uniref:RNA polymerase sigma factor n=1 Tax=Microbispora sp. NPDC088329 TaxID=3154869 RepID=UPI00344455EB